MVVNDVDLQGEDIGVDFPSFPDVLPEYAPDELYFYDVFPSTSISDNDLPQSNGGDQTETQCIWEMCQKKRRIAEWYARTRHALEVSDSTLSSATVAFDELVMHESERGYLGQLQDLLLAVDEGSCKDFMGTLFLIRLLLSLPEACIATRFVQLSGCGILTKVRRVKVYVVELCRIPCLLLGGIAKLAACAQSHGCAGKPTSSTTPSSLYGRFHRWRVR